MRLVASTVRGASRLSPARVRLEVRREARIRAAVRLPTAEVRQRFEKEVTIR